MFSRASETVNGTPTSFFRSHSSNILILLSRDSSGTLRILSRPSGTLSRPPSMPRVFFRFFQGSAFSLVSAQYCHFHNIISSLEFEVSTPWECEAFSCLLPSRNAAESSSSYMISLLLSLTPSRTWQVLAGIMQIIGELACRFVLPADARRLGDNQAQMFE